MNERERFINCALNKPIDRAPFFFYFGAWPDTLQKWHDDEGVENPGEACFSGKYGFDKGIIDVTWHVNLLYYPSFEYKVLDEYDNKIVYQDCGGIVCESVKGKSGIPKILKNPIKTREDWIKIRDERLDPDSPGRFSPDYKSVAESLKNCTQPIQIGAYPFGLFGTLRDMMGVEDLCINFYEEPELIHEIMDYLTDFWIEMYRKVCKDIRIDVIHIWEDMSGKSGSIISPAMVREFMLPNYKKISEFAKANDIPVMAVDTDGICDELIPIFSEGGVNLMLPFEVAAGNNIVELRKRFPKMSMMGGIDKLEVAKGREYIDKQLDLIEPLLKESGYFPALDHQIPPDISYADYDYFVTELRKRIFKHIR